MAKSPRGRAFDGLHRTIAARTVAGMFPRAIQTVNHGRAFWLTVVGRLRTAGWQLAPARCLLCGGPGGDRLDLCVHCVAGLPASATSWHPAAGAIDRVFVPWRYAYPVDAMVRHLKFQGARAHARALGTLLARLRGACSEPLPDLLVPMPLHPRRLRQRGYNQAAEIAAFAGRELRRPRSSVLRRTRHTHEQSSLPLRARRTNVLGAFACTRVLAGVRVALIDDVMTTGNTAQAAAAMLREAGAVGIEVWALAIVERKNSADRGILANLISRA